MDPKRTLGGVCFKIRQLKKFCSTVDDEDEEEKIIFNSVD